MQKKYSLALWWWAAIWFAHIWVIKYIEERNIEINEVSWTSMWSIIASFYALWKTSKEMQEFAKSINFLKLIDLDFKQWLLKWKKICIKLQEIFWEMEIQDLPIKLKIVATNIETWEKIIFEKWNIIDAIRASISIPSIFIPHKIWKFYFIDGWILNNLPIEILDWNDVIAVSAIKKIKWPLKTTKKVFWFDINTWFFNLNFQILQRSLLLMMKQNEQKSLNTPNKSIIFISPDYWNIEPYNFNRLDELIIIGYDGIKKVMG